MIYLIVSVMFSWYIVQFSKDTLTKKSVKKHISFHLQPRTKIIALSFSFFHQECSEKVSIVMNYPSMQLSHPD